MTGTYQGIRYLKADHGLPPSPSKAAQEGQVSKKNARWVQGQIMGGIKIATATLEGGRLHYALCERIQPVEALIACKRSRGKPVENQWVDFLGFAIDSTKYLILQGFLFLL
jgi:hypothetical protein